MKQVEIYYFLQNLGTYISIIILILMILIVTIIEIIKEKNFKKRGKENV